VRDVGVPAGAVTLQHDCRERMASVMLRAGAMNRLLLCFVFLAPLGCDSESDTPASCDAVRQAELDAFDSAVASLEAFEARARTSLAVPCAAIAGDLGGTPPELSAPPTLAETEEACALAQELIGARLDAGATVDFQTTADAACTPIESSEVDCLAACGDTALCHDACESKALFDSTCQPPTLAVTSSDAELQATLEANLPALVGWFEFVSEAYEGMVDLSSALSHAMSSLDDAEGCDAERERFAAILERTVDASSRLAAILDLQGATVTPLAEE
jgi:hypothetical protein